MDTQVLWARVRQLRIDAEFVLDLGRDVSLGRPLLDIYNELRIAAAEVVPTAPELFEEDWDYAEDTLYVIWTWSGQIMVALNPDETLPPKPVVAG